MVTENTSKKHPIFVCEKCDFKCSKKGDLNRHLQTKKHKTAYLVTFGDEILHKNITTCDVCFKKYKSRNGLWLHAKKCKKMEQIEKQTEEPIETNEIKVLTNLVLELVKSNTSLQTQMMEVCKTNSTTNIQHNNHSHNKTFNMQFFLNEQCKDAMNIMDFVNSMTLEFADLEDVGKLGYVEGISGIIIRKLNEMDIYKRPIHCSDGKREIMYVHDDNVWEKENSTYDKLRKAIKHITKKNGDMMIPWSKKYPACMNIEHHLNDVYVQIMSQSMGGKESFMESENKIMKKIAKAVLIDKAC
jgi:hypothetical protein